MEKKEAWEATVGRTLALPLGDLDRTWDLLVFYSGLLAKLGPTPGLLIPLLCSLCS